MKVGGGVQDIGGGQCRSVEAWEVCRMSVVVGGGWWRSVEVSRMSVDVGGSRKKTVEVGGGRW